MQWPWIKAQRQAHAELLDAVRGCLEASALGRPDAATYQYFTKELDAVRDDLTAARSNITDLRQELGRLTIAVGHGIEHEDRREKRIEATVRRARKQLAELDIQDAGLEAEFDGLSVVDGGGSGGGELPTLPEAVAEGASLAPSSIKGVTQEELARARGFSA